MDSTADATVIDESLATKRKLEEIVDDEPPDKKHCLQEIIESDALNSITTDDDDALSLPKVDHSEIEDNIGKNNSDINLAQCSTLDDKTEEDSEARNTKEDIESLNSEVNDVGDKDVDRKECEPSRLSDHADQNSESEQQNVDLNTENNESNDDNKASSTNIHSNDHSDQNSDSEQQNADVNADNDDDNDDNQASSTNTQTTRREKCKYGDKCYRISTEHKAKFSHPGDSDYDAPDNRPECPYGIKCFRKNPQHKLDYKHTRSKRKPTKPARSQSPIDLSDLDDEESMDESVDESDYDPSFIDDESIDEYESDDNDEDE